MPKIDLANPDREIVWEMYRKWKDGKVAKSVLEREYLGDDRAHGKAFTSLIRRVLGFDTEEPSSLAKQVKDLEEEVTRLRDKLNLHGIDPDG